MKTGEEFKLQAELKGITFWKSHDCSICGVDVGTEIENGEASYRSACGCAYSPNHSHGWGYVAEQYNRETNEKVIGEMDEFWGFNLNIKDELKEMLVNNAASWSKKESEDMAEIYVDDFLNELLTKFNLINK